MTTGRLAFSELSALLESGEIEVWSKKRGHIGDPGFRAKLSVRWTPSHSEAETLLTDYRILFLAQGLAECMGKSHSLCETNVCDPGMGTPC